MKTDRQTVLELQRAKPIVEILREALEKNRGKRFQVTLVALDLGVTDATVYNWCEELGIDIDEYRRPAPDAEQAAQEARERVLAEGRGGVMQTRPESVLAYQEAFKALLDAWEEVPEDWRIIMIPPPSFLLLSQCKVDDFNTAAETRERALAEGTGG